MILFESFKHIESICQELGIENYTINNPNFRSRIHVKSEKTK